MASRLLMARVPEGASLIDNPSGGPQGFAMENVYVMAGIPRVMQAMLSTLEGKLESGFVVRSQTVRAYTVKAPSLTLSREFRMIFQASTSQLSLSSGGALRHTSGHSGCRH